MAAAVRQDTSPTAAATITCFRMRTKEVQNTNPSQRELGVWNKARRTAVPTWERQAFPGQQAVEEAVALTLYTLESVASCIEGTKQTHKDNRRGVDYAASPSRPKGLRRIGWNLPIAVQYLFDPALVCWCGSGLGQGRAPATVSSNPSHVFHADTITYQDAAATSRWCSSASARRQTSRLTAGSSSREAAWSTARSTARESRTR